MKEGIDLLNYWKSFVDNAIKKVWETFCVDRKIILTESDLKCHLFKFLTMPTPQFPYSVHSEVTHHHYQQGANERRYRFRDMSLLNPSKIELNDEIESLDSQLEKGFAHHGEAIFFELKFQRLPIQNRRIQPIEVGDIKNLINYRNDPETPKIAYIIWVTQRELSVGENDEQNLVAKMIETLNSFSNDITNARKIPKDRLIGIVFNPEKYFKISWADTKWNDEEILAE